MDSKSTSSSFAQDLGLGVVDKVTRPPNPFLIKFGLSQLPPFVTHLP